MAVLLAGPAGSAMQNVINTVKGKALEVAEYLTPVLKVPVGGGTCWGGGVRGGARSLRCWCRFGGGGCTPALLP